MSESTTSANSPSANGEESSASSSNNSPPHPFDSPHADAILRSSDGVDFRVRKAILAEASSVFQSMFSLPAEPASDGASVSGSSDAQDLPVVPMAEDRTSLEGMLRLCYPPDGSLRKMTLDTISRVFPVLRKYTLDRAEAYVVETLYSMAETASLRVYCLSIQYELEENLVRTAARAFLDESVHSVHTYNDVELDYVSASAYIQLLGYHRRCAVAARHAIARYLVVDNKLAERCWTKCVSSGNTKDTCAVWDVRAVDGARHRVILWFAELISRCEDLVEDRPSGKVITSPDTVKAALHEAWSCISCKKRAWNDVQDFIALAKAEIDQAIARVGAERNMVPERPQFMPLPFRFQSSLCGAGAQHPKRELSRSQGSPEPTAACSECGRYIAEALSHKLSLRTGRGKILGAVYVPFVFVPEWVLNSSATA